MMEGEKGNNMDISEKTRLASLLLELDLREVRADEIIASGDKNFEKLKKIAEVRGAIQTILEYLEK